jgi:hypothetical protein
LLRVLFPQPAAALDVCEEEGRDGGLVVHGGQVGGGMPEEIQRLHCVVHVVPTAHRGVSVDVRTDIELSE